MPKPLRNETQKHYVSRAIPMLIKEGYPQNQATAIAYSMFKKRKKKK